MIPRTLADLQSLVGEQLEEGIRLEFKRQLPESGKNDDLAKDLAAMANTGGGVMIYGIEEANRLASRLTPFDIAPAAERVALVAEYADEPIPLGDVLTIPSDEAGKGFLVVEVQRSDRAPHLVKGTVWGRTAKGNTTLSRRQIGELFARQPGYTTEFGLSLPNPARVVARITRDLIRDPAGRNHGDYFLIIENDGGSDAHEVDWNWKVSSPDRATPNAFSNPFPIADFAHGTNVRVHLDFPINVDASSVQVRTTWVDDQGISHERLWPVGM